MVNKGSSLRVILISATYCRGMGYLENMFPKYLARMGAEVHVVATGLPPYYWQKSSKEVYEGFINELQPGSVETLDGYTLHILGHKQILGRMRMAGLRAKLSAICPDVVQTMAVIGWIPFDAALFRNLVGYRLFTGSHYHASVFPLANKLTPVWSAERLRCTAVRTIPGWFVSLATEKCYAITEDCANVATRYFGVPRGKVKICPLGVDTELFHPIVKPRDAEVRVDTRRRFGFSDSDIVCIYTGRFTEDKNPLLLARAIAELREKGESYRGLFVGNGPQVEEIRKCSGCMIRPFVPVQELGTLFRAVDIGVWPTQESLSMLDAAACGLPIVVNHTMTATERIAGNGMTFQLNDLKDLIHVLTELKPPTRRHQMGTAGSEKIARDFSWEAVARVRVADYETAVRSNRYLRERGQARPFPEQMS